MGKKSLFNDDHFRMQLKASLEEVNVSEALHEKTLQACRDLLLSTEVPDAKTQTEAAGVQIQVVENGHNTHGILSFAGRHAIKLRIVAGVAACILVVLMVWDYMPKMGSSQTADFSMMEDADNSVMRRGTEKNMPASAGSEDEEAAFGGTESEMAMAAAQSPQEPGNAAPSESDPICFSEDSDYHELEKSENREEMGDGTAVAPAGEIAQEAPLIVAVTGTKSTILMLSSYKVPLTVNESRRDNKPSTKILNDFARNIEEQHPDQMVERDGLFFAYQLKNDFTMAELESVQSYQDLISERGLWYLPVRAENTLLLYPFAMQTDGTTTLGEPLTALKDDWVDKLSDDSLRTNVIERTGIKSIDTFIIIDVDNGLGFWICWETDGQSYVMPYMDTPDVFSLKNGEIFSLKAVQEKLMP